MTPLILTLLLALSMPAAPTGEIPEGVMVWLLGAAVVAAVVVWWGIFR